MVTNGTNWWKVVPNVFGLVKKIKEKSKLRQILQFCPPLSDFTHLVLFWQIIKEIIFEFWNPIKYKYQIYFLLNATLFQSIPPHMNIGYIHSNIWQWIQIANKKLFEHQEYSKPMFYSSFHTFDSVSDFKYS